jgi:hypothetical protein
MYGYLMNENACFKVYLEARGTTKECDLYVIYS